MSEPAITREEELEARATKAGLTLIRPPADNWVVIFDSEAMWDACTDLDEAEEIIAANEHGTDPADEAELPPWLR